MKTQAQSFDSRQTMKKQTFEIFHYRDPRPEGVAVHHHDFYEIYFFLSGRVEYRVEGRIFTLEPGDLLLINPREFHQPLYKEASEYERIVLWIDKAYLESLCVNGADLAQCFDTDKPDHSNILRTSAVQRSTVTSYLSEIINESYGTGFGCEISATGALLRLLVEINRMALQKINSAQPFKDTPLVSQILAYIGEHYSEDLSLEKLAQKFYVSKYHLSHEFSKAVGTSVYKYIMLKRLQIAKQMLAEGAAPVTVCHGCGFGDYANFYRAFKAEYGISPKESAGVM